MAFLITKVEQGKALIVSNVMSGQVNVSFTGGLVIPIMQKAELMDISVKTIEIDRSGSDGLICQDNIRADIKVTFFVRVNKTEEDVIKVAQNIGCNRASDQKTLEILFAAKFSEALKTAGKQLDFVDLYTKRDEFRDQIIRVIGTDLNGYSLEDCAIDYLEQTPLTQLDQHNILDAQGIRKITELTAIEHVKTNEFQNNERKLITKQDVEAAEAILELERQKADAEAKQRREIDSVKAREEAETQKIQAEEKLKAETARIKTEEEVAIQQENMDRQVEVARKNRERVVAVETERVEKDRMLEVIDRERETELQTIAKNKEVEQEKRDIATVVRERISVEKTVAEEEEAIKRLRLVEEASRGKEATIIAAEAEAQEELVKNIKAAEAAEEAAKFKGREQLILAEAQLEAADREAKAKIRLAEGTQAESAAAGLAAVQVRERDAEAIEKLGLAEVRVKEADAQATEKMGFAEARIKEADAQAEEKQRLIEALVLKEKGLAEAEGIREKLKAEAEGLAEKAESMKALDAASREHEEYRLRLETGRDIELAKVEAHRKVAEAQASLVAEGLKAANIDIVGGSDIFFDRLVGAISHGKAVDGFIDKSATGQKLLHDYLEGESSFTEDLKDVLTRPAVSSGDLRNLSLASLLHGLAERSEGDRQVKMGQLLEVAERLGVDSLKLGDPRQSED